MKSYGTLNKLPTGVEVRGNSIRISFRYDKQICRETLKGLPVTKANIRYAERKRQAILYQIETNNFNYLKEFPNSCSKKHFLNSSHRVGEALDQWLVLKKATLAPSTVRGYEKDIKVHLKPRWGHYRFRDIRKTELEHWLVTELAHYSPKTINNLTMPFRSVMRDALLDNRILRNPFDHISYLDTDKYEPDPFTRDELYRLLHTPTNRVQELNYAEFACFSGVSICEGIALAWEDVDWAKKTITIRRNCVAGTYKQPKNPSRLRTIRLFDQAYGALLRQREYSFLSPTQDIDILEKNNRKTRTERLHFIFLNSASQKPYLDSKGIAHPFWSRHLCKAEIRHRGINQCRHTFASRLLGLGRYPEKWIAYYLGHTSTEMLHKHYGKWMADRRVHLEKLASLDLDINKPNL